MVRDPIGELSSLVSRYIEEDFLTQRKRLREARMRWIDEHERPKPYTVSGPQDKDGNEKIFVTPFEVGSLKYPEKYDEQWKEEGQRHDDPAAEKELLEGIDAILAESSSEKRLTVLISDNEQHAFLTGGDDKSPHPPIMEGEDHGDYYERVARQYEQAAGEADTGRPGSGDDRLRESPSVDPVSVRPTDEPGASTD